MDNKDQLLLLGKIDERTERILANQEAHHKRTQALEKDVHDLKMSKARFLGFTAAISMVISGVMAYFGRGDSGHVP